MRTILLALFFMTAYSGFTQYATPGTGVKWNLSDLVANSGGAVTFNGSLYTVNSIIFVVLNDTLQITTDETVTFVTATHFDINGALIIDPPTSVKFTAVDPGTGFNGLRIDSSTGSRFKKLTLEYAVSMRILDCSPAIDNCIFQYNNNNASTSFGNGSIALFRSNPVITNSQFLNNQRAAIQGGSNISNAPKIIGCLFMGNNTINSNVPQINLGATSAGGDTVKIINNQILASSTNSGGIGFLPIGNVYAIITGNLIQNNRYGITFNGGSNINAMISYNLIEGNNTAGNPNTGGSGIAFSGGSASSHQNSIVTGNIIRGNLWGITIQNGSKPNLGNTSNADTSDNGKNQIYNNTNATTPGIELYNNSPDPIDAQGNYWGTNDPVAIENKIFHQPDNAALGLVTYTDFVVLASELVNFKAVTRNGYVLLSWQTLTENNSAFFEVEKSNDGRTFSAAGRVGAMGNSSVLRNYSFTDMSVGAYYRLKMVDADGRSKYSSITRINTGSELVRFYPTVITDGLVHAEIYSASNETVSITFHDVQGKFLGSEIKNLNAGLNNFSLSVPVSASGQIILTLHRPLQNDRDRPPTIHFTLLKFSH